MASLPTDEIAKKLKVPSGLPGFVKLPVSAALSVVKLVLVSAPILAGLFVFGPPGGFVAAFARSVIWGPGEAYNSNPGPY